MERAAFGIFTVLVVIFAAIEFNRWRDASYRNVLSQSQRVRRVIGSLLLFAVGAMGYAGSYLPNPIYVMSRFLQSIEMVYWGVCLLLGLAIPVVAYLEAKETLLQTSREQRRINRALIGLDDDSTPVTRIKPDDD